MDRRQLLQLGLLTAASSLVPSLALSKRYDTQHSNSHTAIRLSANENPYGPSEKARNAIFEAISSANRYPLVAALPLLRKEIAEYHKVPEGMVFLTPGSLHALRVIGARLSNGRGNHIAPDLSFTALMRQSQRLGCRWKQVPVDHRKRVDLERMKRAIDGNTQFVYLTNPNNPTGDYLHHLKVRAFCEEVAAYHPLVVDEAYIEFVSGDEVPSMVPLLEKYANLVITRTFSKVHGLAGLRVGYALAKEAWVNDWELWDQTAGIGISNLAAHAAIAALKDKAFVKERRKRIAATRKHFTKALSDLGVYTYPSWTNYVLVDTEEVGTRLATAFQQRPIDIRVGQTGVMKGLTRISIGTDQEMDQVIDIFKTII